MAKPITPEQLAANGSEDGHQAALFCWATTEINRLQNSDLRSFSSANMQQALKLLFAIPNGGSRHIAEAAKLSITGTKSGVPDVCLPYPQPLLTSKGYPVADYKGYACCGLWIEMKKPGLQTHKNGGCSDNQLEWHTNLRNAGYQVNVCYSWEEARDTILKYLRGG